MKIKDDNNSANIYDGDYYWRNIADGTVHRYGTQQNEHSPHFDIGPSPQIQWIKIHATAEP